MNLPKISYVQIQTQSRCNADCIFCPYIESSHAKNPGVMSERLWFRILDELLIFKENLNKPEALFCPYLMQEPLMDKSIYSKIEDIYEFFPNTCVEIATNGYLLNEKNRKKLISSVKGKNHRVYISHHGIDKKSLEKIMKMDFNKTEENLLKFIEEASEDISIRIRGAGSSEDGKHVYFTEKEYMDYWNSKINGFSNDIEIEYFKFTDRAGTIHRSDRGARSLNTGRIRNLGPGHPVLNCTRPTQWIHIMWNGDIRLCCQDYHGEVKLPNLNDMSLMEYFNSKEYHNIAQKVRGTIESEDNFICKRCNVIS